MAVSSSGFILLFGLLPYCVQNQDKIKSFSFIFMKIAVLA